MKKLFKKYGVLIPFVGIYLVLTNINPDKREDWVVDLQRRPVVFFLSIYTNVIPILILCALTDKPTFYGLLISAVFLIALWVAIIRDFRKK